MLSLSQDAVQQLAREAFNEGLSAAAEIVAEAPQQFFARYQPGSLSAENLTILVTVVEELCKSLSITISDASKQL